MAKGRPQQILHKQFAKEFISNGLNGTKAIQALKPNQKPNVAKATASRLLTNVDVQREITALLPSDEVEASVIKDAITKEIKEEMTWKDKHKYLETSLKLKGYLQQSGTRPLNVGVFIKNK